MNMATGYTRDRIKDMLREGSSVVIFTKKDGSQRVMRCTLKEDLIPTEHRPKTDSATSTRKVNESTLAVFDLDKEGWRSFSIESVLSVN